MTYRVTEQTTNATYSTVVAHDVPSKRRALELAERRAGEAAEFFAEGADEHRLVGYRGARGTAWVTC